MTIFYKVAKDKKSCETWLKELWNSEYRFHIDDDAFTIISSKTESKLFTTIQAQILNSNIEICFDVLDDPWEVYYLENDELHTIN